MNREPIGYYIHWPFCLSKCPYCDFNSHVRKKIDIDQWEKAYLKNIDALYQLYGHQTIKSIFFGGGTPSLMPPQLVAKIIDHLSSLYDFDPYKVEITLEANPNSAEVNHFKGLANAGINRVSLGIQALNDEDLRYLGRQHSLNEALQAIETAQNVFSRTSFDLIYARYPGHTWEKWQKELEYALSFNTSHLSLYQLTIEEETTFGALFEKGRIDIPDDDLAASLYEKTNAYCQEKGLAPYEVSNYAKEGQECQHNLVYWNYRDYIGIGPGAHGRISTPDGKKFATRHARLPEIWLERTKANNHGEEEGLTLSKEQILKEQLMMGLRLYQGIKLDSLSKDWENGINQFNLQELINHNYLTLENNFIKTTSEGMMRLNAVLSYLFKGTGNRND